MATPGQNGAVDFEESAAGVSPTGTTRVVRRAGILYQSTDGAAYTPLGGAGAQFVGPSAIDDQQMLFTGLAGNTDGGYRIDGYVKIPAGGGSQKNYTIRPNSAAPAGDSVLSTLYFAGASITGDTGPVATAINLCYQGSARGAGWFTFWVEFMSKANVGGTGAGNGRSFRTWSCRDDGQIMESSGVWLNTSTVISSLQLFGSAANTVLTGSYGSLRPIGMSGI